MPNTILLVEDEIAHTKLFQRSIKRANPNLNVHILHHGADALLYLKDHHADVAMVLLDLNMPVMNGIEFLQKVRADKTLKELKIVVLTTSDNPDDVKKADDLGYFDYLVKPLDYIQFKNLLEKMHLLA
jgi:CheY-like chemotaxis protein